MTDTTLITGVCGMVGSHLGGRLVGEGTTVVGTFYRPTTNLGEADPRIDLREMDVRYSQHVADVIRSVRPSRIFHLAAQSYPTVSWTRPHETLDTNVQGTANIFEAVKAVRSSDSGYDPVVVVACSSAQYGSSLLNSNGPTLEEAEQLPLHPYGVSKVATDLLAYQYFMSNGIRSIRARIFNTSGPRKSGDVISDFARRIAALPVEGGELRVGALTTRRAFLHVFDLVEALIALSERGTSGAAYNISGEEVVEIGELVPMFERISDRNISPKVDSILLRPTDEPVICGDNTRIRTQTGWFPRHSVADIVKDVYTYEFNAAARRGS